MERGKCFLKASSMVQYEGRLGKFVYNTGEWEIRQKYTETGSFDVLVYKGHVQNGDMIQIPDGVVNISYMFEGKPLITPPKIPSSVQVMDYTFKDCVSLQVGAALPYGLKRCGFLYQGCRSLIAGSDMPDTVESAPYMYDGCWSLMLPGHVSRGLRYASGMYRGCKNMREFPVFQDNIERNDNALKDCTFLNKLTYQTMY